MKIKKNELKDNINESQKFIEELIYENTGLMNKFIRLEFEGGKPWEKSILYQII